jgi:NADPH:quinone reductase-like Zn-dependent oxidoreductase
MRTAGVREFGGRVEVCDLAGPRDPGPDEAVVEVTAAGVDNWDELVRTGNGKSAGRRRACQSAPRCR